MPKITPFRNKESIQDDMKEYTQKLFRHRLGIVGKVLACILVLLVIGFGFHYYFNNKEYTGIEVINSIEHADALNTRYVEYGKQLLRYSKDGISCINSGYESVWSQTFNMQDPIVDVCQNAVTCADRGGSQLYFFDETGLKGEADTLLPIQQITVSQQGLTAVLLEDSSVSWIYLYDETGEKLLDARCNLVDTGQPLSLSLAEDGSKLAVSYLQISGGAANSCIVFYNFGSVGENFLDKIVASRLCEGVLMPRVEYLDENTCVVIGEEGFSIYEGAEIPEETRQESFEGEIQSICFGDGEFGLVYEQDEGEPYLLRVFNEAGNLILEQPFDLRYSQIRLSGKDIIIYNDYDCIIYNRKGTLRYQGTFSDALVNVYGISGRNYMVIYSQRTEQIKLV